MKKKTPANSKVGQRFGKLLVQKSVGATGTGVAKYLCKCDCGNTLTLTSKKLRERNKTSCGCETGHYSPNIVEFKSNTLPDVISRSASSIVRNHISKIERQAGERAFLTQELVNVVKDCLKNQKFYIHPPVKSKPSKTKFKRTIVAHMSDTHFGCTIENDEVNINAFNWELAARRTALFMEQVVNYKPQHRLDTDVVLCINGDIIAGVIHDQEWFADLLTVQYAGTLNILTQAIGYLANNFSKVTVHCTPGNHGRAMHKSSKSRAMTHKWDSYETMIFLGLKEIVEAKYKNVTATVPTSPYNIFKAQGHSFLQTHGDTFINVGNPGKSINIKGINEQINKLNSSELGNGHKFAAVIVGHVHTPTVQLLESGSFLVVNGCLSGVDPFAQSIGIFSSNPAQQLFEVTEEHPVGDIRFIELKNADKQGRLDLIIKPFSGRI